MKIVGVIPARYQSSRFPGKPLADICGKPMIWWVYNEAKKLDLYDDVIVATESPIVVKACEENNIKVMLTSDKHPTGTDRVAEVSQNIYADIYVVIMGDEPLITFEEQKKLIQCFSENNDIDAAMLCERFIFPVDAANNTTIKLAINDSGYLIFMSRSIIPYPKAAIGYDLYKNVGCYAFKKEVLDFYLRTRPGNIEKAEDIELLRLLENHKKILTVKINSLSMSVDTYKDLERIRNIISEKGNNNE